MVLSLGGVVLGVILDWLVELSLVRFVSNFYKDIPSVVLQLMMLVSGEIFNGSFWKVLFNIFKIIWFTHKKIVHIIPCHIISLIELDQGFVLFKSLVRWCVLCNHFQQYFSFIVVVLFVEEKQSLHDSIYMFPKLEYIFILQWGVNVYVESLAVEINLKERRLNSRGTQNN